MRTTAPKFLKLTRKRNTDYKNRLGLTRKDRSVFKRVHNIFFLKNDCQVFFKDGDEYIGLMLSEPIRMIREDGVVLATFELSSGERVVCGYNKHLKGFVNYRDGDVDVIVSDPKIEYFDAGEMRNRLKKMEIA